MIKRFSFRKLLKVALVLFLIYLISILSVLFVFSDKLTYTELVAVTDFYEEIRLTDDTLKSDFYIDTLIKIIDKEIVYEELRKDALLYSLKVSENAFEIYSYKYSGADALAYLNRCDVNFDVFNGLECNEELLELHKSFFRADNKSVEDLNTFNELLVDIIDPEYIYLDDIGIERTRSALIIAVSFVLLTIVFSIIDFSKVRKEDKK